MTPAPVNMPPTIKIRAKTQIVINGILRYMGECIDVPTIQGLGHVGQGESEQVVDETASLTWMVNAPGPRENTWQGSRESAAPGQTPGQDAIRQQASAVSASGLEPQQPRTATPEPEPPAETTTTTTPAA